MKKRIAIIGATGELGFRLIPLLYHKYELNAIIRNPQKRNFSDYPNTDIYIVEDISETEKLSKAIRGCVAVINTAYIWFASPIKAALDMLDEKPKHIIFTGSTGVYTKLKNSRGAEKKRTAERFIRQYYDINYTIIRPTMIYGHRDDGNIARLVKALKKMPIFPIIGKADNLIQPVFYKDLLKAYTKALLNDKFYNKSFDIGAPKAISNKELFKLAAKESKTKVIFVHLPAAVILFAVKLLSFIKVSPVSQEQVLRFQEDKDIDITTFRKNFNFETTSISEGMKELVKDISPKKK